MLVPFHNELRRRLFLLLLAHTSAVLDHGLLKEHNVALHRSRHKLRFSAARVMQKVHSNDLNLLGGMIFVGALCVYPAQHIA